MQSAILSSIAGNRISAKIGVRRDYDVDGKTDVVVFRPSNGTWYVLKSTSGVFTQAFGTTGDLPTANGFVY